MSIDDWVWRTAVWILIGKKMCFDSGEGAVGMASRMCCIPLDSSRRGGDFECRHVCTGALGDGRRRWPSGRDQRTIVQAASYRRIMTTGYMATMYHFFVLLRAPLCKRVHALGMLRIDGEGAR